MTILVFDVGGTAIKYAPFNQDGKREHPTYEVPTQKTESGNQIVDQLINITHDECTKHKLSGIAVSSAGVIDTNAGAVVSAGPTIPGYSGTQIKSRLQNEFHVPVAVENDVNCAASGEYRYNQYQDQIAVVLTVGTGIGGAVIMDGEVLHGAQFSAGEIGYLPMSDGQTLQELGCTAELVRLANLQFGDQFSNGREFMNAFRKSPEVYLPTVRKWLANLAQGILTINYVIDPDVFIIGGGIMASNQVFLEELSKQVQSGLEASMHKRIKINLAKLGNDAGMIGALMNFLSKDRSGDQT